MHPAYSVIVFTTTSGAGYGLLFWLSLSQVLGLLPQSLLLSMVTLTLALTMITAGLIASTCHLGHPERAIGALSQWRTSWLSREGIAAIATYVPALLLAATWLFGSGGGPAMLFALLAAIGALVTVYCTGMIYASLRTIRQWNQRLVPIIYVAMAASTGMLLFALLLATFGHAPFWAPIVTLLCLTAAATLKIRYWRLIDADSGKYTIEMATGLGRFGSVRPLDAPHTRPNFVMREMGYSVARKHATKLRQVVLVSLFVLPAILVLLGWIISSAAIVFFLIGVIAVSIGVSIERWLFFAEADHVSQLFYGTERA